MAGVVLEVVVLEGRLLVAMVTGVEEFGPAGTASSLVLQAASVNIPRAIMEANRFMGFSNRKRRDKCFTAK
ncbi:hypothetical protein [Corynebacterium glutamicum]|uniref:hypothetical protein n=1 Tax=Corynebacterium glutamicum TaxID=1718 RepID=UPI000744A494|nr:hypothetical protein [Corynebacterium glutamicum]